MSRDDGTRTHKEVRQQVMELVKRNLGAMPGDDGVLSWTKATVIKVEPVTAKDPEPGHVATIWVQDLEQDAPPKGERPWHVYRVLVVEEKK